MATILFNKYKFTPNQPANPCKEIRTRQDEVAVRQLGLQLATSIAFDKVDNSIVAFKQRCENILH